MNNAPALEYEFPSLAYVPQAAPPSALPQRMNADSTIDPVNALAECLHIETTIAIELRPTDNMVSSISDHDVGIGKGRPRGINSPEKALLALRTHGSKQHK